MGTIARLDTSQATRPAYMERIELLKERVVQKRPEMDLENARILTKSFRNTEGEPHVVQKAKASFEDFSLFLK